MHNKVIFNKIINVSCSFKEIEEFNKDIDKKEFDVDDAFNKYFRPICDPMQSPSGRI